MSEAKRVPTRFYKYRAFSERTLESLIEDTVFFADPRTFNDPLDTNPSLHTDLDADALAEILGRLVEHRVNSEMTAAASVIKFRGPKTNHHISTHSKRSAEHAIAKVRYYATDPDYEAADHERFLFGQSIEEELLRR